MSTYAQVQMWDEPSGSFGRTCHIVVTECGNLALGNIYRKKGDPLSPDQQSELLALFKGTPHRLNFSSETIDEESES